MHTIQHIHMYARMRQKSPFDLPTKAKLSLVISQTNTPKNFLSLSLLWFFIHILCHVRKRWNDFLPSSHLFACIYTQREREKGDDVDDDEFREFFHHRVYFIFDIHHDHTYSRFSLTSRLNSCVHAKKRKSVSSAVYTRVTFFTVVVWRGKKIIEAKKRC